MKLKIGVGIAIASIAVLGLSACSADKGSDDAAVGGGLKTAPATSSAASNAPSAAAMTAAGASLGTASTSLGTIVVDGKGMTVYEYGNDMQGGDSSSCTGQCATNWPAVPGGTSTPTLQGVTGKVGTITGVDGKLTTDAQRLAPLLLRRRHGGRADERPGRRAASGGCSRPRGTRSASDGAGGAGR